MKGLLRKDLLMMKDNYKGFAVFLLLYVVLGFLADNTGPLMGVLAIIMMMLPVSSMQVDEYYHWDQYVLTMPVSRKMVVQSKYLFSLITVAILFLVAVVFELLISRNLEAALCGAGVLAFVAILINSVAIPCVLKWGSMRGRVVILVLCGFAGVLIALIGMTIAAPMYMEPMPPMPGERVVESAIDGEMLTAILSSAVVPGTAFVIAILAVLISYRISCRIYENREL